MVRNYGIIGLPCQLFDFFSVQVLQRPILNFGFLEKVVFIGTFFPPYFRTR